MKRIHEQWRERRFKTKDVGRNAWHHWVSEGLTLMPQSNLPEKVLMIERIRLQRSEGNPAYVGGARAGSREYRICYFIRGQIGAAKDKWKYGQYSPFIPIEDFERLLSKARKEKTLL